MAEDLIRQSMKADPNSSIYVCMSLVLYGSD
jgi:hypothetical protein